MADGDLIAGLQALGRQEREREELKQAVHDLFNANDTWADDLFQKLGKRKEAEAERKEFIRKCEEGEV